MNKFQMRIFLILLSFGYSQKGAAVNQSDFFNAHLPSNAESICSPKVPENFRGLQISMPKKINFPENDRIPICGTFQITGETDQKAEGQLKQNTVIVFVNKKGSQTYSFNMKPKKDSIEQQKSKPPSSNIPPAKNYIVNMYFNIDTLEFLHDLPQEAATYIVYATVLDMKSNVVETEMIYK